MTYSSTEVRATDFAITTVNVPDRLDLRDIDDRKQLEEDTRQRSFDISGFRTWAPRLFLVGLATLVAFIFFEAIVALRTAFSAPQLSQRLTVSLGVPVQVGASDIRFTPNPRLVLGKVALDQKVVLDEVSFDLEASHIGQALQGRGWTLGEARVGPTTLSLEQCQTLFKLLSRLDSAMPRSLATLRFERLTIADEPWLTGSWDVSLVRGATGGFVSVLAMQQSERGSVQVQVSPTSDPDAETFQVEGRNWAMPFGPGFPVEEVIATGQVSPGLIDVGNFQLGGPFGAIRGRLTARFDSRWNIDGGAESEGLDIAALIRLVAPRKGDASGDDSEPGAGPLLQGMASFKGHFQGYGTSLEDAGRRAVFEAPVRVRWAVLNGIDLGYVATEGSVNGGFGGGSTRFASLDAYVVAGESQVNFRQIVAHAGALSAFGSVDLSQDHALSGVLHVDLGKTRVLAPIRVAVRGTLRQAQFGR